MGETLKTLAQTTFEGLNSPLWRFDTATLFEFNYLTDLAFSHYFSAN